MKSPSKPGGGADLRAMRDSRLPASPVSEAARRESSFLRNVAAAGEDLEWILFNQAWTELGFERVGDWWEQRVLPVLVHLDLRPSVALADRVIAAITADEAVLPSAQRRTQREIASIARTSQSRVSRSRPDATDSGSDLEDLHDGASDEAQNTPVVQPPTPDAPEAAYSEPRTGSVDGQPEVDHRDANLGDEDDGHAGQSSDAVPPAEPVQGGASDETETVPVPASTATVPVDGREQAPAGVSAPALDTDRSGGSEEQGQAAASVPAPGIDLVKTPVGPMTPGFAKALDELVPPANPNAAWQTAFLDAVLNARKAFRKYKGEEIAEKADQQLLEEFAGLVADVDDLMKATSAAQLAAVNAKVFRLRSVS